MNLGHKLHYLKHLRLSEIPPLFRSTFTETLNGVLERKGIDSREPRWMASDRNDVKRLRVIHPDVFRSDFRDRFRAVFPSGTAHLIESADRAVELQFDLLGSGWTDLKSFLRRQDLRFYSETNLNIRALNGGPAVLPWHFDFKAGIGWDPKTFYRDIRYGGMAGVDIKVPWELSRCYHFLTLGQAYQITADEKYATSFHEQASDWIRQNPPGRGVNWACPMEVALRACNWLIAWEFFSNSDLLPSDFLPLFKRSLWEHGRHIARHLEWRGRLSSNHYLSNLLGLSYIGSGLGVKKWVEFSKKEMRQQILTQTYEDGFDHEGSTAYHRFATEIFFHHFLLVARSAGVQLARDAGSGVDQGREELGEAYDRRLRKMFSIVEELRTSDGRLPLIGDNDSGRVHAFSRSADDDFGSLLNLGRCLFGGDGGRRPGNKSSEWVWLFGWGTTRDDKPAARVKTANSKTGLCMSGLFVLRGNHDHLLFAAQPNGTRGLGNHTHNDKLSFTLTVHDDDFFIDPGCGVYSSDPTVRNMFRMTSMHNTVEIDEQEQNRFVRGAIFSLYNDAAVSGREVISNRVVEAHHTGYLRLDEPVLHRRRIERFDDPLRWEVTDSFESHGTHRLEWNFILGESIELQDPATSHIALKGKKGILRIRVVSRDIQFQVKNCIWSPAYGVIRKTRALRMTEIMKSPCEVHFELDWRSL